MAEQFYTILTKIGKAKIANATALGNKVNFTTLKVGDGKGKYYNPTEEQEGLVNEVWQVNINSIRVDENNPNWVVIEVIIPSSVGGFMIREAGVFDDENNMLAIGKYPETYKPQAQDGSTKDLVIRTNLEISNTSSVTLKVDPTVILATQKDIQIINSNMVDLGERVSKNEENITSIKSDLADITTDNKRLTKDKTITGAINELFTNANNGKSLISSVVGTPLLATDTFQQQRDKIQTLKNTFATNLTAKQQVSNGSESLLNLINKVANINTGKKYAKGELKEVEFTENFIISYLDFKPSIILISGWENRSPNYVDFTINMIYTSDGFICGGQYTSDQLKGSTLSVRAGAGSGNNFKFTTDFTDDITATNNGFAIQKNFFLTCIHSNFKWIAIE
ncbi:phage tail protein [Clostridium botulinum]|uniref:Tail fiber protein H n=1 Tax=Clostridium botulinum (strain Langeland / NCTC 10281 / Type F) TaxID=441772 RepID=A7GFS8_CLOBL|nr:phage tail protein [Clostridium botulinum]ABS41935.1 tail fiber protein H [Clostridium botulinum F str. Langeland]ADG00049.1 tail fiber protein H [Clostridium botulinum F str. 230613]KKM42399.1 tail fiber protein [Clostridium botulinum]MBY6793118.1 phage tail protein [Clostridium botulinum]MBY6937328.1 phage tail protein [Clostridium botulinum]